MEKVESPASHGDPEAKAVQEDYVEDTKPRERKHYSFYLSILMLSMIALIISWDVTALSLALPVSFPLPSPSPIND